MATSVVRSHRESPMRWRKAAERAINEGVEVRQCAGSGLWVATSGTDGAAAYELEVYRVVAIGCSCLAGMNEDPVCKHRAAYYLMVGALAVAPRPDPQPEPPAPAPAVIQVACPRCHGRGVIDASYGYVGTVYAACRCTMCGGAGRVDAPRSAA